MNTLLVTGGAGFIGSNLVRCMLGKYRGYGVIRYDELRAAWKLNLRATCLAGE
ncbi:MAG: GDP-mannose 4,6-dehydratase [Chloroflexota bacterium]